MPKFFPFDPNTRKPSVLPPPESCDGQFHVFGSPEKYPVRPGAGYQMPSATFAEAMKMHKILGIQRGIIVQPTTYGMDYQALLDALKAAGSDYRGCAIAAVFNEADDAYISTLHEAGVRGARFNFLKKLNMIPSPATFERTIARIRELGWYAKIQPDSSGVLEFISMFENLDIPVVIDHMGQSDPTDAVDGPTTLKIVELLKKGNFWALLSNGHKRSKLGYPWDDMLPIARAYIDAAPDRVLWASDWPHPVSTKQPPNDADLLELLYRYAPDEAERRKILVDNPATLFGFAD